MLDRDNTERRATNALRKKKYSTSDQTFENKEERCTNQVQADKGTFTQHECRPSTGALTHHESKSSITNAKARKEPLGRV